MIVSEDGELRGIIDWDGFAAVPRSLANEIYPGWLTRDWEPAMYGYGKSMDRGLQPKSLWEDSPKTLAYYRGIYENSMTKRCHERRDGSRDFNFCRMSLVWENLAIAAHVPYRRDSIVQKMVQEIRNAVKHQGGPDLTDLADNFVQNAIEDGTLEPLGKGFEVLLAKGGLPKK